MAKQALSIPALMNMVPTEGDAYLTLEGLRWADGVVCPHCGSLSRDDAPHYFLTPKDGSSRATRTGSRSQRRVWKCRDCRKQFSVLTGTIFQGTKISLRTWLLVIFEMCASKNGVSAREIERKYDLTPKTAWFLTHRIREAMKREPLAGLLSGTIVADETWLGGKPSNRHGFKPYSGKPRGVTDKTPVLSLVHKETGEVRSSIVPNVTGETLKPFMAAAADLPNVVMHTDSARAYVYIAPGTAGHESVNHFRREYVRGEVSTNAAESFFSQLKRSLDGTHHAVSVEHLPRYLAEFDFRHTTKDLDDSQRMARVIEQAAGRRLSYKPLTDGE